MTRPFPSRLWLKLNGACLPGLAWFIVHFSPGETLLLALLTIVPANVWVILYWTGRIQDNVGAKWASSPAKRVAVPLALGSVVVLTFCGYYYYVGESLGRVLLVGTFSLLVGGGALVLGVWVREQRGAGARKGRPEPPEIM